MAVDLPGTAPDPRRPTRTGGAEDLRVVHDDRLTLARAAATHAPVGAPDASDDGPLTGRNLLVVGINYAPEPTGIAPYTTRLAEHLAHRGAAVEVLTGLPHYPWWAVEEPYRHRRAVREPRPDGLALDVRRLWHYVPSHQSALTRAGYELSFLTHAALARPARAPHAVVAVTPALGGAVAAAQAARRHDAGLLVLVQDLVARAAGQSGIRGGGSVAELTARLEGYALRRADVVAIVSESFRAAVRGYGVDDDRITVTPNWTHIRPSALGRDEARAALAWPAGSFVVTHTGNMGLKQDLAVVVEAARLLPAGIDVMLVGDGNQRRDLQRQAAGLACVHFVPPLDGDDYPVALAASDVLLVNERPTVHDMSLPSKLTSYLCARRPVVAAVSADGATACMLADTGGAALVIPPGDPARLAASLVELRDDDERRAAMGRAAVWYARDHLRESVTLRRLDALVDGLLSR